MLALRYIVIGLAVLAMVWPSAPPQAITRLAGSEWRIVEIAGTSAPRGGTVRFTQTSVRGRAPCNAFLGTFRETDAGIEIGGIHETHQPCAGQMELERAFIAGLARARSWRADGSTVLLLDLEGKAVARLAT